MNLRIIKKFFRKKEVYHESDIEKMSADIKEIEEYLNSISKSDGYYSWISLNSYYFNRDIKLLSYKNKELILKIEFKRFYNKNIYIYYDDNDILKLAFIYYYKREDKVIIFNVGNLKEIKDFFLLSREKEDEALEKERIETLNEEKYIKIANLKYNAMVGKFRAIANENGVAFTHHSSSNKMYFYLKVSKKDLLLITIPRKNFNEAIMRLEKEIKYLIDLHKDEIRLRTYAIHLTSLNPHWEEPES